MKEAMSTTYLPPPADPEIAGIVSQLADGLLNLQETLDQCREQLEQGYTLGELRGVTDEEYAALYQIARDFCDRGDFRHALPVALQLALHDPANYRYPFIAGACLQRLGQPEPAALMYALACDVNPDDAASAYRLGECLIAASRPDEAKSFLHKAVDLSYGKFHCRELQERARKKLEALH